MRAILANLAGALGLAAQRYPSFAIKRIKAPRRLTRTTTAGVKRAAAKARNVKRHKAAMRRPA
jgi:hypothetical protein